MSYVKSEMLYNDYKWNAMANGDNPYYNQGTDHSELNRMEGYEILYFINHLGEKHCISTPCLETFHKIEKMIRTLVPLSLKAPAKIEEWILANWSKVKEEKEEDM